MQSQAQHAALASLPLSSGYAPEGGSRTRGRRRPASSKPEQPPRPTPAGEGPARDASSSRPSPDEYYGSMAAGSIVGGGAARGGVTLAQRPNFPPRVGGGPGACGGHQPSASAPRSGARRDGRKGQGGRGGQGGGGGQPPPPSRAQLVLSLIHI